jgi:hypothetical protein
MTVCAELVNLIHDFRLRDVSRHARAAAIRLFASQRRLTFDAGDFDFGLNNEKDFQYKGSDQKLRLKFCLI